MSHKPTKPIQQQIAALIERRKARVLLEIKDFQKKKDDAEYMYGLGNGSAGRYTKCIEEREHELEELESLANSYGGPVKTTTMNVRYRYRCQCGCIFETRSPIPRNYADCPFCRGGVSKETEYRIEREVIVPPMPYWEDDKNEWRKKYE
jgi:hypothetical protein